MALTPRNALRELQLLVTVAAQTGPHLGAGAGGTGRHRHALKQAYPDTNKNRHFADGRRTGFWWIGQPTST